MTDKKISALTGATTPLAGNEVLPIVQGSTTVKVSVANLTAGRAVAMAGGLFTDSLIQSTAAKGVNFTANTSAAGMTSRLLNWYEEGAWTPAYVAATGTLGAITYANVKGVYTRVGRLVTVTGGFYTTAFAAGTGSGDLRITGLPFANSATISAISIGDSRLFTANNPTGGQIAVSDVFITLFYRTTANGAINNLQVSDASNGAAANLVYFTASYQV